MTPTEAAHSCHHEKDQQNSASSPPSEYTMTPAAIARRRRTEITRTSVTRSVCSGSGTIPPVVYGTIQAAAAHRLPGTGG